MPALIPRLGSEPGGGVLIWWLLVVCEQAACETVSHRPCLQLPILFGFFIPYSARLVSTCPRCLARLSLQPDLAQPNTPAVLANEPCLEPCEPPTTFSPQRGKAPVICPTERHMGLLSMTHRNGSLMSPCRSLEPSSRTRHRRSTGTLISNPDEHHRTNPRQLISARKGFQLIHTGPAVIRLPTNKGRCTIRREIMPFMLDKLVFHANPAPPFSADPLTPTNRTTKQPGTPAATTITFPRLACPVTALILLTDIHIQQAFCQAHP
jgi:hypothetical protein